MIQQMVKTFFPFVRMPQSFPEQMQVLKSKIDFDIYHPLL